MRPGIDQAVHRRDGGRDARSCSATAPTGPRRTPRAPITPTSQRVRAASGSAWTTTGPIPIASSWRAPTPAPGAAARATRTRSRGGPTGRPTSTTWWSARARTSMRRRPSWR